MDLRALEVRGDVPVRFDLRHPGTMELLTYGKEDEHTMYLMLLGRDSDVYKKNQRKLIDKRLRDQQKYRSPRLTAVQLEEEAIDQLALVTVGGKVFFNGEEIEVTPTFAKEMYQQFPWIKEQVDAYLEDRTNFLES